MSKKHALDAFFTPVSQKKSRLEEAKREADSAISISENESSSNLSSLSHHHAYPFPVAHFPSSILDQLTLVPACPGREINDQPDLDLVYFQPFIPASIERALFHFLRAHLFFYRVQYKIKRGGFETDIHTPRYTTVFGVDTSSQFSSSSIQQQHDKKDPSTNGGNVSSSTSRLVESSDPTKPIPKDRYKTCTPRPLPECLDHLRRLTEAFTGAEYNFCLVNYYASGSDSISYHSDDEHFLGPNPSIASFSLGATRDFCMKHKNPGSPATGAGAGAGTGGDGNASTAAATAKPLKLPLSSGDMVLMRGKSQANWLHSIPKRQGKGSEGGRINITFRKGVKIYATENYYQYNVGSGAAFKWDDRAKEMKKWKRIDV